MSSSGAAAFWASSCWEKTSSSGASAWFDPCPIYRVPVTWVQQPEGLEVRLENIGEPPTASVPAVSVLWVWLLVSSYDVPYVHTYTVSKVLAGLPSTIVSDLYISIIGTHQDLHHLHVVVHSSYVQRRVASVGSNVNIEWNVVLLGEVNNKRYELRIAKVWRPSAGRWTRTQNPSSG